MCGYQPSVVKQFVIQKQYISKHSKEYSKYVDEEKHNLIEGLKLVYREGCSPILDIVNDVTSEKAVSALYVISHLIVKQKIKF